MRRRVVIAVLLAGAVAFAGWSGWSWWQAGQAAAAYADTREEVLRVGEQGIANLTTLDHERVDEGLDRWLASSTGPLHDSLAQGRAESRKQIEEGASVTVGKVVDAAVTEFEPNAGTAEVIAAVEITVTPAGGQPTVKRNRFQAGLNRTGTGWKLSSLRAVPVGAS